MADIFDYLKWRGDISLLAVPLCDADRLVLSELVYLDFSSDEITPLSIICESILKKIEALRKSGAKWEKLLHHKEDEELLRSVIRCPRYSEMKVGYFESRLDREAEEQFAAMTVFLPDSTVAVVFRGTDWSLVGWKEDLSMTFSDELPSQKSAVSYLSRISELYDGAIELIGHSKGGNLAVYAAAFSSKEVSRRIIRVTNLDGPGFNEKIVESSRYLSVINKVYSVMPRSSIVGALFSSKGHYRVIESRGAGLMQHITFNWEIMGGDFVEAKRDDGGQKLNNILNKWISSMENDERKRFIDSIWSLIDRSDILELSDLIDGKSARGFLKKYRSMDTESREFIRSTLSRLRGFAKEEFSARKNDGK